MASILLLEDHRSLAVDIASMLEAAGHRVSLATTTEDAVATFRAEAIELVIADLMIDGPEGSPRSGAVTLFHRIRVDSNGPSGTCPPMLMISGAVSPSTDERIWRSAGADEFLPKPFFPDELVGAVERMLAARRP
ncbi:MAG: response regulator [Planctomycetota bacterium]